MPSVTMMMMVMAYPYSVMVTVPNTVMMEPNTVMAVPNTVMVMVPDPMVMMPNPVVVMVVRSVVRSSVTPSSASPRHLLEEQHKLLLQNFWT